MVKQPSLQKLWGICLGATISCALVLLWECHFFSQQAERLIALQEEYRTAIATVRTLIPPTEATESNRELIRIDRSMEHLRKSACSYLERCPLEQLSFPLDQWQTYTAQLLHEVGQPQGLSVAKKNSRPTATRKTASKIPVLCAATGKGPVIWTIEPSRFWFSSLFGPRKSGGTQRFHRGIDLASARGTPIRAVAAGRVIEARHTAGYGNTVVMTHADRYKTRYAHMHTIAVHAGQQLKQGETIGTVGDTGFTIKTGKEGTHLHFELYRWGKLLNPLRVLPTQRT